MKTLKTYLKESNEFLLCEKKFDSEIKIAKNSDLDFFNKIKDFKHSNELGYGVEAVAHFIENTQTVVKILLFSEIIDERGLKKESTYKFLQEITKEYTTNNPHFPRIHSVRFYRYDDGLSTTKFFGVVKMERLFPLKDFDKESLLGAIRNVGFDTYNLNRKTYNEDPKGPNSLAETGYTLDIFLDKIVQYFKSGRKDFVIEVNKKNPKFAKAMVVIRNLIKKYLFRPDLHEGNMMIRLTAKGPQLVFTDPLIPEWWK